MMKRRVNKLIEKNEKGFTIIEVMLAIVLLTVGIFSAMRLQIASINGNETAMKLSEGVLVVSDTIETFMGLPMTDLLLTSGDGHDPIVVDTDKERYTITYTVQDIVAPSSNTYKEITFNTSWVSRKASWSRADLHDSSMTNTFIKLD
ncbi:MAG: prepilin-type N-terminal cleavage/methylation domain-containing protein [Proteobacteria bacterium]|nr:prepilin-type N-terminal cleavage/methylation domain-containing protein [Pseudomonadota bacterium]